MLHEGNLSDSSTTRELQSLFIKTPSKARAKNDKKHINIYFLICIFSMSASFMEATGEALYGTASMWESSAGSQRAPRSLTKK